MELQHNRFELIRTTDLSAVVSFYESVGYNCEVRPDDRLLAGFVDGGIVAAVRLCEEEGRLVMRGMYVAENLRGRGLGARLLRFASSEIGPDECWCVPYVSLIAFYSQIGFRACERGVAPDFLAERQVQYTDSGRVVTIMRRSAEWSGTSGL